MSDILKDKDLVKNRNSVRSLLSAGDDDKSATRRKADLYLTNPLVRRDGTLANKYLNYQGLLDSGKTSARVKKYITEATGLQENTQNTANSAQNSTDTGSSNSTSNTSGNRNIGFISAKYETGGAGAGTISSGAGDYGGISYGIPQFSSTTGSADNFVSWLKSNNPQIASYFGDSKAGTDAFSSAWTSAANDFGDTFGTLQTQYAYDSYVKPLVNLAKEKTGVDYTRSPALTELVYSTAIQFGGGSLGLSALGDVTADMSDEDIINTSYDKKINNCGNYFSSSSAAVQESVKNRFQNERNDVLELLNYNSGNTGSTGNTSGMSLKSNLVNTAKQYLGTNYVWGGASPQGFDCSGLMQYVLGQNGINIPRTTYEQYRGGTAVSSDDLQPGDLVFFKGSNGSTSSPGHVGMYIGNGQYIQSPKTGDVVKVSSMSDRSDYVGARRYE